MYIYIYIHTRTPYSRTLFSRARLSMSAGALSRAFPKPPWKKEIPYCRRTSLTRLLITIENHYYRKKPITIETNLTLEGHAFSRPAARALEAGEQFTKTTNPRKSRAEKLPNPCSRTNTYKRRQTQTHKQNTIIKQIPARERPHREVPALPQGKTYCYYYYYYYYKHN